MDIETLKPLVSPKLHEYLDKILEMCNASFAVSNSIELISISEDLRVVMKKTIVPGDLNSNGFAHGGASYGLMDHTFAVCCNVKEPTVGLSCDIVYHRPCVSETIEAVSEIINESKSLITVGIKVTGGGKLIASATCIGFKARMKKE